MFRATHRFLRDLGSHKGGNTIAIAATAILLLMTAVGGGIDMSRAYMAKTNLQAACDAGVLAGRKAMAKTGTYGPDEKAKADKMFNFNLAAASTNSTGISFVSQSTAKGEVTGTASATTPTIIMKMFKFYNFNLSVDCSAELQMASADIVFVLDTTGSMNCAPGDSCNTSAERSGSKISALRDALRSFHKTVAGAVIDSSQTRIRYAFVPYSMTVNAKQLISSGSMPTSWVADSANYQTKLAYFGTPASYAEKNQTSPADTNETSLLTTSGCNTWASGSSSIGVAPANVITTSYSFVSCASCGKNTVGTCTRKKHVVTTSYYPDPTSYKFNGTYRYKKSKVATAGLTGGSLSYASAIASDATVPATGYTDGYYDTRTLATLSGTTGITTSTSNWSGCVEEPDTVQQLSMSPVPAAAYDLQINTTPASDPQRWKPYWGQMVYDRGSSLLYQTQRDTATAITSEADSEKCPAEMRLFKEVDTSDPNTVPSWIDTYVNGLTAAGNTYHDIGMIWGGVVGSTRGPFASNVNADATKYPSVSRHIIFMTDGIMEPTTSGYSAYGIEYLDHRVAPYGKDSDDMKDYHNNRFLAACAAAQSEGYTVWVIAFGTSITTQMMDCSTADRAYYASDSTELNNTFKFIAGQVADLRINK